MTACVLHCPFVINSRLLVLGKVRNLSQGTRDSGGLHHDVGRAERRLRRATPAYARRR